MIGPAWPHNRSSQHRSGAFCGPIPGPLLTSIPRGAAPQVVLPLLAFDLEPLEAGGDFGPSGTRTPIMRAD